VSPRRPRRRWRADLIIRGRAQQLRRDATRAEAALWSVLRNRQLDGYRFRRQHPMGDFILDFFCSAARLVIEVDGESHTERTEYDRLRTEWLAAQKDCHVLRFSNAAVLSDIDGVREVIRAWLQKQMEQTGRLP
jgi:very-short-patch-repair endonuclease